MKLGQNVCLNEISDENENGSVRSKTGSLSQMLEKTWVCFGGLVFSLVLMKLGQNVWLNKISDKFFLLSYEVADFFSRGS